MEEWPLATPEVKLRFTGAFVSADTTYLIRACAHHVPSRKEHIRRLTDPQLYVTCANNRVILRDCPAVTELHFQLFCALDQGIRSETADGAVE